MADYIETFRGIVYPWHCDQFGHLNVQHYVGMYDQASVLLFIRIGFGPAYQREKGIGFADVRHVIEYKAELRAGAAVTMGSRFLEIGTKSLRHEHRLTEAETGEVAATFDMISVHFDLEARKATPFPPQIREQAEALIAAGGD